MNDSASDTHVHAVVISSGFGGSVTAYRLAEAGLRVCVLERGKAYPPGEGLHGMYNIWSFSELGAVVCSGLGGGSLIYANVLIRKDPKWFVKEDLNGGGFEYWPVTRADLDPHYAPSTSEIHRHLLAWREEQPTTGVAGEKEDARERLLPWR